LGSSEINSNPADGIRESGPAVVPVNGVRELANQRAISQEVGALLIVSGIAGILLPGPVGTPLLILGCVMVWPKAFERMDLFFAKRFPRAHHLGVVQSTRFLNDLERRYPVSR
jgi:hypothetical protein